MSNPLLAPWYEETGETRAFERRIRATYPEVRVRRSKNEPRHHVYACGRDSMPHFLFSVPLADGLSDSTINHLDYCRRQAMRSSEDHLRERSEKLKQDEAQAIYDARESIVNDVMSTEAGEFVAREEIAKANEASLANAKWSGRHTSASAGKFLVKKFNDTTGTFDDGYKPVEAPSPVQVVPA